MNLTLIILFTISLITSILLALIIQISNKNKFNKEKSSPYECGFDPLCHPRIPFSLRFFLIAILFLIFDVEISLILPFPFSSTKLSLSWIPFSIFLLILIFGLLYEWTLGSLEWAK